MTLTLRERPIIFSAPMVRALLDGRKTQTRRIVNPRGVTGELRIRAARFLNETLGWEFHHDRTARGIDATIMLSPYGAPGDRLWVRESFRQAPGSMSVHYRADPDEVSGGPWRPSIHMPRAFSRITLELTAVRVHRLQQISPADAVAEGARYFPDIPAGPHGDNGTRWQMARESPKNTDECLSTAPLAFGNAWNVIHGKRAPWASNPWVWVLTFRRVA